MKKLCLIFTLCVCLLIPNFSVNASNADVVYTEGYFEYVIEDNAISICGYFGKEAEVTVPAMIAGYPVSKISKDAFADCKTVKTVNLPDTIMEIENEAFGVNQSVVYDSNVEKPGNPQPENPKPENSQSGASQSGSSDSGSSDSGSSQTGNVTSESSKMETTVAENSEVKGDNKTDSTTASVNTSSNKTENTETEVPEDAAILEEENLEEAEAEQNQEPGFEEVEVTLDEDDFVTDTKESKENGNGGIIAIVILVVAAVAAGGIVVMKKRGNDKEKE